MLDNNAIQSIFQMLVKAMNGSLQRRATRKAERVVAEDYDEDDEEMDELCNQSEGHLLYLLHECIGAVIRTHGKKNFNFMCFFCVFFFVQHRLHLF